LIGREERVGARSREFRAGDVVGYLVDPDGTCPECQSGYESSA